MNDNLLKLPEVCEITKLSPSHIYALMKRSDFPQQIRLTRQSVVWSEAEVRQWIEDRKAARKAG